MSEMPGQSQTSAWPEKHCTRPQLENKDVIDHAKRRKDTLSEMMKQAAAFGITGLSITALSSMPTRSMCVYCDEGTTAYRDGVQTWPARVKAEVISYLGWDQWRPESTENLMKNVKDFLETNLISQTMTEPSPILLLILTVALAFAVTYIRYMNRADRYQDRIIAGWMIAAVTTAWLSEDFMGSAMPLLLWAILLALASSAILHRAFDLLLRARGGNENQVDRTTLHTSCLEGEDRKNSKGLGQ